MNRQIRAAALLVVAVLLASCGAPATVAPAGHSGSPGHAGHSTKPPPPPAPLRSGERFVNLTMAEPYRPNGPRGGTDDYRCFLIDPELTSRVSLTGAQFQPQNAEVVHHAIFFKLDPAQAEKARKVDESTPGQGWTCFGGEGAGDGSWVAHWAPGTNEALLDPRYGYDLPPGSRIVMQIHYNTLNVKGDPGTDRSGVRLRVTDQRLRPLQTGLLPAPVELPCTPQESGPLCDRAAAVKDVAHRFGAELAQEAEGLAEVCGKKKPGPTQSCDVPIEESAVIHGLAGHMHLLGRAIKVELNPGGPGARTLLDVPEYNFDDQSLRKLATPVKVKKGDVVRVTCTHDAKLRSMLPELRDLPPRYVVWGAGTSDEMCLGIAIMSQT